MLTSNYCEILYTTPAGVTSLRLVTPAAYFSTLARLILRGCEIHDA